MLDRSGSPQRRGCTGCKEDQGPYGVRYKYAGGVFCESCWRFIHYARQPSMRSGFLGFFRDIWDWVVDVVKAPFQKKRMAKAERGSLRSQAMAYQMKASKIPANPAALNPQKR